MKQEKQISRDANIDCKTSFITSYLEESKIIIWNQENKNTLNKNILKWSKLKNGATHNNK